MRDEPVEIGKESLVLLAIAQSNFLLGLVIVGIDSLISFVLHYLGVSLVLWGEPAALGGVLACENHSSARHFVWGTWCLQGLCSGSSVCSLLLLVCFCGKRNFLEVVILGEKGHTWQSKDLFLKSSDFKSQDGVRLLNSHWSHVSLWSSHRDRFRVCWWRCSSSSCRNICCWYAKEYLLHWVSSELCCVWRLSLAPLLRVSSAHWSSLSRVCDVSHYWTQSINDMYSVKNMAKATSWASCEDCKMY